MFEGIPSDTVEKVDELNAGDHIKLRRYYMLYAHHAIVTNVNILEKKFTVIHYMDVKGKIEVGEQILDFNKEGEIKKINYADRLMITEGLERLPPNVTVAIAEYFKCNINAREPYMALMNNCEHFAFTCTLGFAISFQQLKAFVLILLPFLGFNFIQSAIVLALTSVGVMNVQRQRRVLTMRKVVAYDNTNNTCIVMTKDQDVVIHL